MTIGKKLLISMVALTTCVLIATLSLARWSFEQGFSEFINGLERERLGRIAEQVVDAYTAADNSWTAVQQDNILSATVNNRIPARGPRRRPPPGGHLPPRSNSNQNQQRFDPEFSARPAPKFKTALPITLLLDTSKSLLLSANTNISLPLTETDREYLGIEIEMPVVLDGVTIAYLKSYTLAPSSDSLASRFNSQQLQASYLIGIVCLLLTIALAFFISTMFVKPIRLLNKGVTLLTEGKYSLKLPTKGNDELAQLMRNTQSLANTLEQARSQKNRWFADISHELRTPLTILVGEIEAMHAGIRQFDAKQLASIEQEVTLLHRLVDDLYQLSLSDVGALKYEFNKGNVSQLVKTCVASFAAAFKDKNIHLQTNIIPDIWHRIDAQRFEQMLYNLLNNSLKYTNQTGTVKVSLLQTQSNIELTVEDSYPGAPEHECEQLFDTLYQRNTSRTRSNSGAGLGLAICKNIAQSHQGNISATPSKLGGIKILVTLKREES